MMKNRLLLFLLFCGVLAPLLYIASDIICAIRYPGYSYTDQAISELSALGSPTAPIWKTLMHLYSPLIIAFGIGAFQATPGRPLKTSGILLILFGLSGYVWLFFPMNMRGNIGSASDTGHLVMSALTVLLLTAFISFGSRAKGKIFQLYSFATITVMLSFGLLVARDAPKVAANQPTPWMGVYERISVFSPMIWILALSILLVMKTKHAFRENS